MVGENNLVHEAIEGISVLGGREVLKLNERKVKTRCGWEDGGKDEEVKEIAKRKLRETLSVCGGWGREAEGNIVASGSEAGSKVTQWLNDCLQPKKGGWPEHEKVSVDVKN